MINIDHIVNGRTTAESRWARFGPYYAMFPVDFAFNVVQKYSSKGDRILDPFAGRGSSIFAGAVLNRHALGVEINPVGWLYGTVKLNPASEGSVLERLGEIYSKRHYYSRQAENMPEFYSYCFCPDVLRFLLSARRHLDWQYDKTDATLMAMILIHLHGKLGEGLSNQMRMTKSLGMTYAINWWKEHDLVVPPVIDSLAFFTKKIAWRYAKGLPSISPNGSIIFGDSTSKLAEVIKEVKESKKRYSLLFTSPPYCSITNYHADQWLRLWMLGDPAIPVAYDEKHKGRFINKDDYRNLLDTVFSLSSSVLKRDAVIYVRTDAREFTLNTTLEVLKSCFPKHRIRKIKNL
jgi:DNA modification methylase